jgi:hypothetical protein
MTKAKSVGLGQGAAIIDLDRARSVLQTESAPVIGHATPRIATPLNDLPSRGLEVLISLKNYRSSSCRGRNSTLRTR